MATKKNALHILKERVEKELKLQQMVGEERVNLQVALAIREAREAAGLTQKELARMIGTTQSVISQLEDADYEGYTLKTLEKIAEALKRCAVVHLRDCFTPKKPLLISCVFTYPHNCAKRDPLSRTRRYHKAGGSGNSRESK